MGDIFGPLNDPDLGHILLIILIVRKMYFTMDCLLLVGGPTPMKISRVDDAIAVYSSGIHSAIDPPYCGSIWESTFKLGGFIFKIQKVE